MVTKKRTTQLTPYLKKEIVIATMNKGLKRDEKKIKVEKKCMMCGTPTNNSSGFCDQYLGSIYDCKNMWKAEYKTMPTQKELNAKWRIIS